MAKPEVGLLILRALATAGPDQSAYSLMQQMAREQWPGDGLWARVRRRLWLRPWGEFYVQTMRLERAGIVRSRWDAGPEPRRRLYTLRGMEPDAQR